MSEIPTWNDRVKHANDPREPEYIRKPRRDLGGFIWPSGLPIKDVSKPLEQGVPGVTRPKGTVVRETPKVV